LPNGQHSEFLALVTIIQAYQIPGWFDQFKNHLVSGSLNSIMLMSNLHFDVAINANEQLAAYFGDRMIS
jgi:hypothetical protein